MVHHSGVLRDLGITAVFRDAWSTYRKVVTHNYLHHEEMIAAFAQQLRERPAGDRVLDIGCGDCWLPIHIFSLPGMPAPTSFTGLDSTAEALAVANAARASFPTGCAVSFVEADMTDYIEDCPSESCDVIISTLAIHHLDKEGKAALFAHVYRCLAPGGVFLWGDVYNSVPGSSRDEALQRWSSKMKQYPALTEEERENIWEHASTYDIPEDLPTAEALLNEAGFEGVECLFKDGFYIATWVGRKAVQNGA